MAEILEHPDPVQGDTAGSEDYFICSAEILHCMPTAFGSSTTMAVCHLLVSVAEGIWTNEHVTELAPWQGEGSLLQDDESVPGMLVHEEPAKGFMRAHTPATIQYWALQFPESLGETDPVLCRLVHSEHITNHKSLFGNTMLSEEVHGKGARGKRLAALQVIAFVFLGVTHLPSRLVLMHLMGDMGTNVPMHACH